MAEMLITAAPGICLSASNYALGRDVGTVAEGNTMRQGSGRWVSGFNVEFIAGFAQKIAGSVQATTSLTEGIPRAVLPWRDNTGGARVAVGTETHLYYLLNSVLTDITPLRAISTGTLTDPFSMTSGSEIVAVADTGQTLANGDWVFLVATSAVGGLTINGWYQVSARSGTGYSITASAPASATAGPGGGATTYQYPRVTLSGPFTTVNASTTVTVHHVASGAAAGGYVTYSGAAAVGGLTINGEYQIQTIVDVDNYTITAASAATSGASGGGSVSVIYDIIIQQNTQTRGVGFGRGPFGAGAYGRGLIATPVLTNGWTLSAYGNQMLAAPIGGTIYVYNPVFGGRAYPLLNAPLSLLAMFVTPERFVVALGINGNLLQMAWADQTDYTVWTATPTNTANEGRTLIGGSYFTGGIGIRDGVSLIFTNRCAFTMTYTGNNEVYSTQQVGDNCGLVDPTAACTEGGIVYWMSDQDFWSWNGGVSALPSDDVRAFIFNGGINRQMLSKCTATLNRAKKQVKFWYPSSGSTENDVGMIYQIDQSCFSPLNFGRSAAYDAELLNTPVSADITGLVYYDETGTDANGAALAYDLQFGMIDLSNGDRNADIFGFTPDFQTLVGTVDLTILTANFPSDTATEDGPYPITSTTGRQDLRSEGKMFSFSLAANAIGATFRIGVPRLEVQPAGARR